MEILKSFEVKKDDLFNVVSLKGGKYYVPANRRNEFYVAYETLFNEAYELNLDERTANPRLYLDIEDEKNGLTNKIIDGIIEETKKLLAKHFLRSGKPFERDSIRAIKIFNSVKPNKCHVHFWYKQGKLRKHLCIDRNLLRKFCKILGPPVDPSISIRMIGSYKRNGEEGGLYLPFGGVSVKNLHFYSILPTPGDYQLILKNKEDKLFYQKPYEPCLIKRNFVKGKVPKDFDFGNLLEAYPKEVSDDYDTWSKVIFFCSCLGVNPILVEGFSSKSEKYIEGESTQRMETISESSIEKFKNGAFGALVNILKRSMKTEDYLVWRKENLFESSFEMYDILDPYTFGDFKREFSLKTFNSEKEAYEKLSDGLSKFTRIIEGATPTIIYKESSKAPFKRIDFHEFSNKNKFYKCKFIKDDSVCKLWIFEPLKYDYRLKFNSEGFYPEIEKCPENVFNIWPGFEFEKNECSIQEKSNELKLILNHIFEVWADSDKTKYNHILDWFSFILQNPGKKTQEALVLLSKEGAGKGIVLNLITNYVLGLNLSFIANSVNSITGDFNSQLHNKLFLWVDETSVTKEKYNCVWSILKNLITETTMSITQKYKNTIQAQNMLNMVFTLNRDQNIKVSPSDRRYCILDCSDKYCGKVKYWEKFPTNEEDSKRVGFELALYLLRRPKVEHIVHLVTKGHEEMVKSSRHHIFDFIEELQKLQKTVTKYMSEKEIKLRELKGSSIYKIYKFWAKDNGFSKPLNSRTFGQKLKSMIKFDKGRSAIIYSF